MNMQEETKNLIDDFILKASAELSGIDLYIATMQYAKSIKFWSDIDREIENYVYIKVTKREFQK